MVHSRPAATPPTSTVVVGATGILAPLAALLDVAIATQALHRLLREGADYKVVLAGRQGSDSDNGQVPLILATLKGWGCVSFAKKVEVSGDKAVIECEADGGEAVYESSLPVVITANADALRAAREGTTERPRLRAL